MGLLNAPTRPNPVGAGALGDPAGTIPRITVDTVGGVAVDSLEVYRDAVIVISGERPFSSTTQIRGRGNSTWAAPKKPYRLKLSSAAPLLGMPADRDWVLLANYYDPTSARNSIAFEMGYRSTGLAWTPQSRYVELVLNGTFMGLYQLVEHIKISPQKLNLTKVSGTSGLAVTGGYTLEIDQRLDTDATVVGFRTTRKNVPVTMDDPDGSTAEHKAYIQQWINDFEAVLYSKDWLDPTTGYARFIDRDSFIDWYLINEITKNADSNGFSSIKCYKTADTATSAGKLYMGPIWDFDRTIGYSNMGPTGWWTRTASEATHPGLVWTNRMMGDPAFWAAMGVRLNTLRTALIAGDVSGALIDRLTDRLLNPIGRDKRAWAYTADTPVLGDAMRLWLSQRLTWLASRFVTDTTAPTVPGSVTGLAGNTTAGLTWAASTDTIFVARYRVRRGGTVVADLDGLTTSFTDTGRTNGVALSYTVSALDPSGNESAQSTAVTVTPVSNQDTTPPTISTFTATPGDGQVTLAWAGTDNVGITRWVLTRGGATIYDGTATTLNDTGRTNGTALSYSLVAYDAAGNVSSASTATTTPTAPAASAAETFTGADGAAWPSPWTAGGGAGRIVALSANSGRLSPPASAAYGSAYAYRPAPNDGEVLLRWQWQSATSDRTFDILARGQTNNADPKWRIRFWPESVLVGVNSTVNVNKPATHTIGVWRWTRLRWQGTTVKLRTWADGSAEPTAWDVESTDATGPTSGNLILRSENGGDGVAASVLIDDLTITSL